MDGNVIFGENGDKGQGVMPPAPATPSQPVLPSQAPPAPQVPMTPPPPISGRSGILGTIVKILIPLAIIVVLVFVAITFVFPMFRNGTIGGGGNATITYWGLWEPKEVMQPIIDDFEKQHPTIKVNYELRDIKQYKDTLLTRINGGDGPDVFRFHNSWTKTMQSILTPIPSSVIAPEEFKKYYPVVQADMTIHGGIYGIPLMMDTLAMFVNDEILQDAGVPVPQTWADFEDMVDDVTVPDQSGQIRTYGAAIGSYDNINRAPDILSALFAQSRIDLKTPSKASPASYAEALGFYTNFVTGQKNFPKVWNPSGQNALDAFAAGNVAMYFGYSWDILTIHAKSPDLKYSIHPFPYLTSPLTVASYWAEGVSSKSRHQKEALLFLQFLTKKETQQKLYTLEAKTRPFGELPARSDLALTFADNPLLSPFLDQAKVAVSSYFVSDTHDNSLNEQLNGYLGNAVRSILGNTSAESAVDTLLKGIAQVLLRYGIS